ncbi:uncharacterized protein [Primulina huaijiensis]|uniref:uncharacterized protein n=1 Tax=Primulina huaijiensis TaxID=1492673 RepID=UPI003CC6E170
MVGGGNRRDDGSLIGNNTNGFAALENLRRNKKSDKEKVSSKGANKSKFKEVADEKPQVFWAPAPLTVKSWADVEDEEDDDYYATTAPPQAIWGRSGFNKAKESETLDPVEESESEDELLDEVDDDMEDDHDHQEEVQDQPEPLMQKPVEVPSVPKETERQLSKKERRKKELAELDAILADFGVNTKEKAEEESSDINKQMKGGELSLSGDAEANGPAPSESKTSKKKKKKDKIPKDEKPQDLPKCSEVPDRPEQEETARAVQLVEEASVVDVQERLKKVLSKKKKSGKEMDAATRTASMEAAARSARLAAAKKKEKNHFNQQPTR